MQAVRDITDPAPRLARPSPGHPRREQIKEPYPMPFNTDAYIRRLASTHGLTAKPCDTDRADLTDRALRAELADIKRRTRILHAWSEAVIADHETQSAASAGCGLTARRRHTPAENRRNAARRRANQRRAREHG